MCCSSCVCATTDNISAADVPAGFLAALCDDVNTPKALAELFVLANDLSTPEKKRALLAAGQVMGLLQQDPEAWFATDDSHIDKAEVERLIAARQTARQAKDYAAADAARDQLTALGVVIEDTADGTIWRLAR